MRQKPSLGKRVLMLATVGLASLMGCAEKPQEQTEIDPYKEKVHDIKFISYEELYPELYGTFEQLPVKEINFEGEQ